MEHDYRAAVYPAVYVRDWVMDNFKVKIDAWYYHLDRLPPASVQMAGYSWFTESDFDAVKAYFLALPSVKRRVSRESVGA